MFRRTAVIIFIFALCSGMQLQASETGPCSDKGIAAPNAAIIGDPRNTRPPANEGIPEEMQRKQAVARNKERQAALKKDTDELFRLANDLKQKVHQTSEQQLSDSVSQSTQTIQK